MGFLDCTVCFDSIAGPVYQCTEGHLLCQTCWSRLNTPDAGCPTCSAVLGRIRCRFAEQIRDALSGLSVASPSRASSKKLPHVPRLNVLKSASDKIGCNVEDLRSIMARDGVGLMDAVILSARKKIRSDIQESGGVNAYERKKQQRDASVSDTPRRAEKSNNERQNASPRSYAVRESKDKQDSQLKPKPPERSLSQEPKSQMTQSGNEFGKRKVLRPKDDAGNNEALPKDVQEMYLRYKETISRSSVDVTKDWKPTPLSARSSHDSVFDYERFAATVAKYSTPGGSESCQRDLNANREERSDVAAARTHLARELERPAGYSASDSSTKEKEIIFHSLKELNEQERVETNDDSILESYKKFRNDLSKQIRSAAHTRPSSSVELEREEASNETEGQAQDLKEGNGTALGEQPKKPGDESKNDADLDVQVKMTERDKGIGNTQHLVRENAQMLPTLDLESEQYKKPRKNVKLVKTGGSLSARSPASARNFHESLYAASKTYKDSSPRVSILRNHPQALEAIRAGEKSGSAAWNIVANVRRRLRG